MTTGINRNAKLDTVFAELANANRLYECYHNDDGEKTLRVWSDSYYSADLQLDALGVTEEQVRTAMRLQYAEHIAEAKRLLADVSDDIEC